MIVLDTNVVSALMQRDVEPDVVSWLDDQPPESIWTTAVTVFEIAFGLEILAAGHRRRQLEDAFDRLLEDDFEGRILPFERSAPQEAASIAARRRRGGPTRSRSAMRRSPASSPPGGPP